MSSHTQDATLIDRELKEPFKPPPRQNSQHEHHEIDLDSEETGAFQKVLESMKNMATLSSLMRMLGSLSLIAGMSVFLLQGWGESSDSSRFLMMLGQTLLMSVAGFGLHYFLKENKGARVFFGLSLLSVTANFSVLGALIYSVFQFDSLLQGLPGFATWVMADLNSLAFCVLVGTLVLVPVSFFGFRLFARGNTKKFTAMYLASCVLMLIPIRDPTIIIGLLFIAVLVIGKLLKKMEGTNTLERKLAAGVIFVPLMIMGFRSLYFYQVEAITALCILCFIYYGVRKLTCKLDSESRLKITGNLISLPLAGWISISLFELLFGSINGYSWVSWAVLLSILAFNALMADLYIRSQQKGYATLFSVVGSLVLALGFTSIISMEDSVLMILMAIITGLAWAAAGYQLRSRTMVISGVLITGAVFVTEFVNLITIINLNNWLLLSLVGAAAIIIASIAERHGVAIKLKFEGLINSLKEPKSN